MSIKIALKNIAAVSSSPGTSKFLIAYGADGQARLLPESEVNGGGGGPGGAATFTCPDDGKTYEIQIRIVDGEPTVQIVEVI